MGKLKVRWENQIVYTMPFRILRKIWDIAWDDAIFFIFFLVSGHLAALFAVQVSFPDEENLWLTEQDFQPDSLCNWNASVIVEYNCLELSWFLKLHRGENSLQTRKVVVTIAILYLAGVMKIRKQRAGTRNLSFTRGPVALACVADEIWPRFVTSAKQCRDPCSGPPTDSTNYRKCVSNFLSSCRIGKLTMAFLTGQSWLVLKSRYTGGAQNKDFGAVS